MGIMNSVMGGVGVGVQPKDNPDPSQSTPSAATQTFDNSLPPPQNAPQQPAQPPQPNPLAAQPGQSPEANPSVQRAPSAAQGQPKDVLAKENKDVDDLFKKLEDKAPEKEKTDEDRQKEVDDLFNQVNQDTDPNAPIISERQPGESWLSHQMKALPEAAKFIGAQMRAHIGNNPLQQRQAFESMYGDDNVKAVGDSLYFRPDKDSKFRKIDQTLWGPMADFMTSHALQAIPLAANALAQGAVDLGSVAGAPESGGVSMLGVAGAGAAGGAVESGTRQALQGVFNLFSAKPQTETGSERFGDVAKTSLLNAAGAPIAAGAIGALRQGVSKVASTLQDVVTSDVGEKAAGWATTKMAMAKNAFKQFVDQVYPGAMETDSKEFASNLKGMFDKAEDRLGSTVGAIKSEVKSIASQSGIKASVDSTLKTLKNTLFEHGYAVDADGAMSLADQDKLNLVKPDVKTALEALKNHYNLVSDQVESQGGIEAEDLFKHTTDLQNLAKFDKGAAMSDDATSLYRKAWKASVEDRNQLINRAYETSDSPYADTWKAEFSKYHDQIGAVRDFQDMLKDDGSRENFLKTMMSGDKGDKGNLLDAAKNILEPDSKEWKGLQGQMVNHLIDKFSSGGPINSAGLLKYMTNKENSSIIDRLMDPKDQTVFKKMVLETGNIDKTAKMSDSSKNVLLDAVKGLFRNSYDAAQGAYNTMLGLGSSKMQVDYLLDDGFNKLINDAEGPAIQKNLMEGRRLLEGLTSKMQVVDQPSTLEKGVRTTVKRYAPAVNAAMSSEANKKFLGGSFNPQGATGPGDSASP